MNWTPSTIQMADSYASICFVRKPFAIEEFAKRIDKEIAERNERIMRLDNQSLFQKRTMTSYDRECVVTCLVV